MDKLCITKKDASVLLAVSVRMVDKYIHSGKLSVDHMEKHKVMIPITEVYGLREKIKKSRKRGQL